MLLPTIAVNIVIIAMTLAEVLFAAALGGFVRVGKDDGCHSIEMIMGVKSPQVQPWRIITLLLITPPLLQVLCYYFTSSHGHLLGRNDWLCSYRQHSSHFIPFSRRGIFQQSVSWYPHPSSASFFVCAEFRKRSGNHHGGSIGRDKRRTQIKMPNVFEQFTPDYMASPFDVDFHQASSSASTPASIANDGVSSLKKKRMANNSATSSNNVSSISSNINKSRLVKLSGIPQQQMENPSTIIAVAMI